MGDLLKSCGPYRYEYAERAGLTLELRSKFRVTIHWESRRPHSLKVKSGSVVENPEIKYFCNF